MLDNRLSSFRSLSLLFVILISATTPAFAAEHPDPTRWEETITKLEANDDSVPKNGILFVGSSSIRMWKLKQSFPDRLVINRGFGGSIIADSTHYIKRLVTKHNPRIVVLYAGDNDIAKQLTPQQVTEDFEKFVAALRADLPDAKLVYIAIKPSLSRWKIVDKMRAANNSIRKIIETDPKMSFVDIDTPMIGDDGKPMKDLFVDDGLHLSVKGYKLWANLVRPHLK